MMMMSFTASNTISMFAANGKKNQCGESHVYADDAQKFVWWRTCVGGAGAVEIELLSHVLVLRLELLLDVVDRLVIVLPTCMTNN